MAISVGYRVKSVRGVQFRQWATNVLRQHLVRGYTLNQVRFEKNAAELEQALELIRRAAQSPELTRETGSGLVEIVSRYTQTFLWLQRYDEGMLNESSGQHGGRLLDARGNAVINDTGLAALTLLVAESDPAHKDTLIRLIMHMLAVSA